MLVTASARRSARGSQFAAWPGPSASPVTSRCTRSVCSSSGQLLLGAVRVGGPSQIFYRSRPKTTKGRLKARFAAVRVHAADAPPQRIWDKGQQHLPGDEAWLIGEHRTSGEKKYYLANLPAGANLRTLAATIKARWICEQAHQQLKEELGPDHFEGRSWRGLHRHALMTMIAYAFLQHRRLIKARREKKNQRPTASTKLASRAPRHRRPHHSAASAMPALPKMDRCQTAA